MTKLFWVVTIVDLQNVSYTFGPFDSRSYARNFAEIYNCDQGYVVASVQPPENVRAEFKKGI